MPNAPDLLDQKSHFAFGKNWSSYAKLVTDSQIAEAIAGLKKLAGDTLAGKRFLDIGCGSGLHSLAALRLGASEVVALDIDPDSVATTRSVLDTHASGQRWTVSEASVFNLDPKSFGTFDVVYSWGVLHHTGDMYRALRGAAAMVAPNGEFIFALYRHTYLCWFWKLEKRWYTRASAAAQARVQAIYVSLMRLASRGTFDSYVSGYAKSRGMDFHHDVHDWLGGWPYESISPAETDSLMQGLGMRQVRAFVRPGRHLGIFGSGCDEYVYGRPAAG
ncbi:MAG: class I SAM-dependent methyltransferase [Proteobacteria bacterium]|nr:class I SAM-dependent methyltransferase [Pseudomonadota bacterium]